MAGYPQGSSYPYGAPPANPYGSAPPQNPYGPAVPPQPYGASAPPQPYGAGAQLQPYGTGAQPQLYGAAPTSQPYGAALTSQPYGAAPPQPFGAAPPHGYGGAQPSEPYSKPEKPGKAQDGGGGYGQPSSAAVYGADNPFAALVPSQFPPGTDPSLVACFKVADQDGSGLIDDTELHRALSSYNQTFSLRTVHLLMYLFTSSNIRKIGPKEFTSLFYSLQSWRTIFERFDRDRSGKIDASELREALMSMGFAVPPVVLDLLLAKFDKSGGMNKAIEYDNFIECCLTVKGLTEKFKEKDTMYTGSATFTYELFMLTVLPFLIA
ncbi:putative calcium-binding protein CML50 [Platanthera guangdongensis]|uniref:Calcium-binding protein CML50 n=1 Tax=Platanthera guangdongensis TaxID=2320717 RepID=A0ABR2MU18_9ASPA